MKQKNIVTLIVLGTLAILITCWGQKKDHIGTFETIWKKVNETYFDINFGGLDWKSVHDRYLPRILTIETDEEFYRIINQMLWELKVSHANLVPPGSFPLYEPLVFAEGSPGMDIRFLKGAATITLVKPDSPAARADLRPGYTIQAIDNISVGQIVREVDSHLSPPFNSRSRIAKITKMILGHIYGAPGKEVCITYSDENGEKKENKIVREKRKGVTLGPNLFLAVDFEAKRLDNGIGYIRVNTLQPQLANQISKSITSMGNISGLIFDLRGNSGGEIEQMPELFLQKRTMLYLKRSRSGESKIFFDPNEEPYTGPLILLIDALSGSASELFAAAMQSAGRAVVVGERSPGAVMEMDSLFFQDGAIFMYPTAQLVLPDGTVLEGYGVVPDIEVGIDRELLLEGVDSQVASAVRYLKKELQK